MKNPYCKDLILRGLLSMKDIESPEHRAKFLDAAAELLAEDSELATQCTATASCLRAAENAQLHLFDSIRTGAPRH